jgi:hypothetical protein
MNEITTLETLEQDFCDMLDVDLDTVILGITFTRSEILRKCDPVAYRVGLDCYFAQCGVDPSC